MGQSLAREVLEPSDSRRGRYRRGDRGQVRPGCPEAPHARGADVPACVGSRRGRRACRRPGRLFPACRRAQPATRGGAGRSGDRCDHRHDRHACQTSGRRLGELATCAATGESRGPSADAAGARTGTWGTELPRTAAAAGRPGLEGHTHDLKGCVDAAGCPSPPGGFTEAPRPTTVLPPAPAGRRDEGFPRRRHERTELLAFPFTDASVPPLPPTRP